MTGTAGTSRRPGRRLVLALIATATLALLCCCGGLAAAFLTDSSERDPLLAAALGCGETGPLDPNSKLPKIKGFNSTQIRNAAIIIKVGAERKVPARGWVIAVATAMQESSLINLPHLGAKNDHDSVGLFQQRPSQGWGSPEQLQDPEYAAKKFYEKLVKVAGWQKMPLTEAAQAVQISAYPDAYAKHEPNAIIIVNRLTGGAGRAAGSADSIRCATAGEITAAGWTAPVRGGVTSEFRSASRPNHNGVDLGARRGEPIFAAAAGLVVTAACDGDSTGERCRREGSPSTPGCGWYVKVRHDGGIVTMYCHMQRRPLVKVGEQVAAGQQLGVVGNTGRSSGPHLHFEVHDPQVGGPVEPIQFLRERGVLLGEKG
ncbi:MAG TPA: M23 family metallopeptidase [Micromonosporaceae bacterium]|nr:M23 family metallopeptidase [Micromonosporaceae bacterium]